MKRSYCFILLLIATAPLPAQKKTAVQETAIEKVLKEIKEFNTRERKKDSAEGHPLGSLKEEDFLRRYTFYKSIETGLQQIDKSKLAFDEEINLELIEYDIEDEIANYTFKAYLNPILSDEGFHTHLPGLASGGFTTKKDYDNYIRSLRDMPTLCGEVCN